MQLTHCGPALPGRSVMVLVPSGAPVSAAAVLRLSPHAHILRRRRRVSCPQGKHSSPATLPLMRGLGSQEPRYVNLGCIRRAVCSETPLYAWWSLSVAWGDVWGAGSMHQACEHRGALSSILTQGAYIRMTGTTGA